MKWGEGINISITEKAVWLLITHALAVGMGVMLGFGLYSIISILSRIVG